MLSLFPVLAVGAFVIAPAAAQARTTYGTETGGIFTAFGGERVSTDGKKKSANFVLENEAGTGGITCAKLASSGFAWNEGGFGDSTSLPVFEGCKLTGGLATLCGAGVVPNGNGIIQGEVSDKVKAMAEVEVDIDRGFGVKCGAGGANLGEVTVGVKGAQAATTGNLVFKKAKGLTFVGEKSQITGENETKQVETNKQVVI